MKLGSSVRRIEWGLFLIAFSGLLFQVCLTRYLYILFNQSTYSVTAVLSCYLSGLAAGSLLYPKFKKRFFLKNPARLLGILLFIWVAYSAVVISRFEFFLIWAGSWIPGDVGVPMKILGRFAISSLFLAIPTVILGILFPLFFELWQDSSSRPLARFYAIDLLGSALGTLVAGFILIPFAGVQLTTVMGTLFCLAALLIVAGKNQWRFAGAGLLVIVLSWGLGRSRSAPAFHAADRAGMVTGFFERSGIHVLWSEETPFGQLTVTDPVVNQPASQVGRSLYIDRRVLCYARPSSRPPIRGLSEYAIATDGVALASAGKRGKIKTVDIGLGCGITLSALLSYTEVEKVDVVEINPRMPEAARFFSELTKSPLSNPRTRLHIEDAWFYFQKPAYSYDLVVLDVEEPAAQHSSPLYTREFFARVKQNLRPDGVFALWSYPGSNEYYAIILKTLRQEFGFAVIRGGDSRNPYFIASNRALNLERSSVSDSDLRFTRKLKALEVPLNTIDRPALLEAWLSSTGRDPMWR